MKVFIAAEGVAILITPREISEVEIVLPQDFDALTSNEQEGILEFLDGGSSSHQRIQYNPQLPLETVAEVLNEAGSVLDLAGLIERLSRLR